jgi:hypothetical protein
MGTKLILTAVAVTVAAAATSGSSAANPALAAQSRIIGIRPIGLATSVYAVLTAVLNADGSVTVTTQAAVANANATMEVIVATVANSD